MNLSVIRQYWLYFLQKAQNRTPSCPMLVSSLPLSVHSDPMGQACRVCVTDIANRDVVRRLTTKSREVSKPRVWMLWWSYRSVIWQTSRERCCRGTCQISGRLETFKPDSKVHFNGRFPPQFRFDSNFSFIPVIAEWSPQLCCRGLCKILLGSGGR